MKSKFLTGTCRGFIILSAVNLLYVTILAFINPQAVMELVGVHLPNNDAISSIRGVYGGVGLTIVLLLIRCTIKDISLGLLFLSFLWGLYALSRFITSIREGELGAFGSQWLKIETCLFVVAALLWTLFSRTNKSADRKMALR